MIVYVFFVVIGKQRATVCLTIGSTGSTCISMPITMNLAYGKVKSLFND